MVKNTPRFKENHSSRR